MNPLFQFSQPSTGLHGITEKDTEISVENYLFYSISEDAKIILPQLNLDFKPYTGYPRMIPRLELPFFSIFQLVSCVLPCSLSQN